MATTTPVFTKEELEAQRTALNPGRNEMGWRAAEDARAAGQNDPCPCGSGREFRHCCLRG